MDSVSNKLDNKNGVQESAGNINTYVSGHSGHSSFIEKMIIKGKVKIGNIEENNNIYKERFRENTASTVSKPKSASQPDPRFSSQRFRTAVRLVLESLGLEPNFGNFKHWDKFIDWISLASSFNSPSRIQTACSICGKEDSLTIEIIQTKKRACSACWVKIKESIL